MKQTLKPSSVRLGRIAFTNNKIEDRIVLRKVLLHLANLDTALDIMSKTLLEEEYSEYVSYMENAIRGNISGLPAPEDAEYLIKDSLRSKVDAFIEGILCVLKYIKRNDPSAEEEQDLLFYTIMEVFEDSILGLHSPYMIQFVVYALVVRDEARAAGFLSFLCSNVHSADQRRELMAVYISSFIARAPGLSKDALSVAREYVEAAKDRVSRIDDRFSQVLLSGLAHIEETSCHDLGLADFLAQAKTGRASIKYPFDPTPIEDYNQIIKEYSRA
ncbi:uncharacterized protein NEMAJ01_1573 [Nematocida major]|uniref:uncharacterized protein n=1 Tax=Nematocida major TaxID=1912982 RepID=UPI0020084CE1|nr:uncharacterized protein NEMAJ01_1573 [Nematocida major]KAH9386677.1 hypothetical protein NEMAJ01_1573 [Nematocida major]